MARYCIYFNDVFQYRFVVDRTKRLRDCSHIHHLLLLLFLHKNLLQKVLEIVSFLTAYKRTGRPPAHCCGARTRPRVALRSQLHYIVDAQPSFQAAESGEKRR
jgi:hypothetical protein